MGVPAFFRWLSRKYPSLVVHCIEEKPKVANGTTVPVDSSQPNPNRVEFDCLYLDMNGIIHPCCHPENKAAPKDEDEMMVAIFEYIDRIISIVRPRRLLYMAIDGVAPRAKMNQQRSRRFRAAKETVEKVEEISRIRNELEIRGAKLPPEKPKEEHFDSNCITPGTPFMARLAKCLHYYIHDRLNNDPGWKNISVILSDANVPGEGEHKIMDYIRKQRANPDHDPNTHHCLCGADADLIMLGLATHEPNFTIIREEFKPNQPKPCEICSQLGHEMKDCMGMAKEKVGEFDELEKPIAAETEFIFIRLNILREYLAKELAMANLPFQYDFERAVDDWVFLCFFVGNDFLPHLPSLEIREGAIDRLVRLYKDTVYKTGGFLTNSGLVNLSRVQLILRNLGDVEDEIFKRRQANEENFRERQKSQKKRAKLMNDKPAWVPQGQYAPKPIGRNPQPIQNPRQEAYAMRVQGMNTNRTDKNLSNLDAAQALRGMLKSDSGNDDKQDKSKESPQGEKRKKGDADESSDEELPFDAVRLWEDGWKDRYYTNKFEVEADNLEFRYIVAAAYVRGLCWVLRYYYQGCPSWKWYFPYHYAPFASDFVNIGDADISFEKGTRPFKPLEQLMSVFPAASSKHLPDPWAELMTDPESIIVDFYPDDFRVDLNGKKFAWQGVALLPFVDERRLLKALEAVYPLLTPVEMKRNIRGDDRLYVGKNHPGYDYLMEFYQNAKEEDREFNLNSGLFHGAQGTVLLSPDVVGPGDVIRCPIAGLEDIPDNQVVSARYRDPKYDDEFLFPAKLLPNAIIPPPTLKPGDLSKEQNRNWRPQIGMAPSHKRASLDSSGKRALNWNMRQNERKESQYTSIPHNYDTSQPYRGRGQGRSRFQQDSNMGGGSKYTHSRSSWPYSGSDYRSQPSSRWSDNYQAPQREQYGHSRRDEMPHYQAPSFQPSPHQGWDRRYEGYGNSYPSQQQQQPPTNTRYSNSGSNYYRR